MLLHNRIHPARSHHLLVALALASSLTALGCEGQFYEERGRATIAPLNDSGIKGEALFELALADLTTYIWLELDGLEADFMYPVAIVDSNSCSQLDPAAIFNPTARPDPDRPGYLGYLYPAYFENDDWSLRNHTLLGDRVTVGLEAANDVTGKAMVIYEKIDPTTLDEITDQPPENFGAPVACGIVGAKPEKN